jgi:hypothetical protein
MKILILPTRRRITTKLDGQLMLDGFGAKQAKAFSRCKVQFHRHCAGIEWEHMNNRFSEQLDDTGEIHGRKALLLLTYRLKPI